MSDELKCCLDEFTYYPGFIQIKGWAFHPKYIITGMGYLVEGGESSEIKPWQGIESRDVEATYGPRAALARFDQSFGYPDENADKLLHIVLIFRTSCGRFLFFRSPFGGQDITERSEKKERSFFEHQVRKYCKQMQHRRRQYGFLRIFPKLEKKIPQIAFSRVQPLNNLGEATSVQDTLVCSVDTCTCLANVLIIKGWAFDHFQPIRQIELVVPGEKKKIYPWRGQPDEKLPEIYGERAKDSRFEIRWSSEKDITCDVFIDIQLVFVLDNKQTVKREGFWQEAIQKGPNGQGQFLGQFFDRLSRAERDSRVLEIGSRARSGVTNRSHWVPDWMEYVGLDVLEGENVDVVCDAHELATVFPENHFDFVFSLNVFEHLLMPWKVALEMNRVMKKGALVMIMTHQSFPLHDLPWDFWRYSQTAWHGVFNSATGFRILDTELQDPVHILPVHMYQGTFDTPHAPAYIHSMVLAEKTADTALTWDVDSKLVLDNMYPE